jgi:hypothetical protein
MDMYQVRKLYRYTFETPDTFETKITRDDHGRETSETKRTKRGKLKAGRPSLREWLRAAKRSDLIGKAAEIARS